MGRQPAVADAQHGPAFASPGCIRMLAGSATWYCFVKVQRVQQLAGIRLLPIILTCKLLRMP